MSTGALESRHLVVVIQAPRTRAECIPNRTMPESGVVIPCPFFKCRHHLPFEDESCVLDFVDRTGGGTLEEIGAVFGVTRERIRQMETKALKQLSRRLRSKGLKHLGAEILAGLQDAAAQRGHALAEAGGR